MNRIIYPNNESISIIIPVDYSDIHLLAKNLVPKNIPYKIIDESLIPSDRTFRGAWQSDFSNPDGYGEKHDNN